MDIDIAALQAIVAPNTQARGASSLCRPVFWERALELLIKSSRVVIVTGFYIRRMQASETDGPPGAVILGRALASAGRDVLLLTDSRCRVYLEACSRSVGGPAVICADDAAAVSAPMDLLVFIERPGRAVDGCYYNMKGVDISDVVAPLDDLAESASERGIPVLSIGDGGNEAGMGALYDPLKALLPDFSICISKVPSNVCLPVDVSNWGGYALAALLSVFYHRWLGLDENEEDKMLQALLKAGAVDGILGLANPSVDGISLPELNEVSLAIKNWYFGSL
ncbi:MAG: DUF4392 domain-containing protein [Synergistaceae bacterium]|nr:DUF4392 domain-containing protein [Synergistaceae bacterium]